MAWFARCYAKRVVNVNINIIVAGLLAMGVTVAFMHTFVNFGWDLDLAKLLHLPHDTIIGGTTFLVDLIADLAVYYVLHWLANHMPRKAGKILDQLNPAYAHLSFVQDATLVQVERMALSPVFYVIALGGQYVLRQQGLKIGPATALSFAAAIAITRCLHTIWMLYQERRALHRLKTRAATAAVVAGTTLHPAPAIVAADPPGDTPAVVQDPASGHPAPGVRPEGAQADESSRRRAL